MKRRAAFLLFVAAATSALVIELRESMEEPVALLPAAQTASCGILREGIVPAGCQATYGRKPLAEVPRLRRESLPV